jgi:ribose 5-phosphate isomerase A
VLTDSGNFILDVRLGKVTGPGALAADLNQIPGVVENGFFVGMADGVVIGHPDSSSDIVDISRK